MQKVYTLIETIDNTYLSVSIKEIKRLDLAYRISSFSYIDLTRIYLEEDIDLQHFVKAKLDFGEKVKINRSYRYSGTFLPGANYNPSYIDNPLVVGSTVIANNKEFEIVRLDSKIVIQQKDNVYKKITVPRSNPYAHIQPKEKLSFWCDEELKK